MPRGVVARGFFPPEDAILAKALACESRVDVSSPAVAAAQIPESDTPAAPVTAPNTSTSPRRRMPPLPLSRFSISDLRDELEPLGVNMSYSTLWRLLAEDAIRPWLQEQWLFPRDPRLLEKATPVVELYHRRWEGQLLGPRDYVLCGDEMTGLQAKSRLHPTLPSGPKRRGRYEFEYERHGTLCYLGFFDVFSGRVYGETSAKTGIEPFEAALGRCLAQPRYQQAERLFLILDNGSSHHPSTSPARLRAQVPNLTTVHLPVHSSWLNQIEIYFSIVQRKALTPRDFPSLAALEQRLKWFEWHYNRYAQPFQWNFNQEKLEKFIERLSKHEDWLSEARDALQARREVLANQPQPVTN